MYSYVTQETVRFFYTMSPEKLPAALQVFLKFCGISWLKNMLYNDLENITC